IGQPHALEVLVHLQPALVQPAAQALDDLLPVGVRGSHLLAILHPASTRNPASGPGHRPGPCHRIVQRDRHKGWHEVPRTRATARPTRGPADGDGGYGNLPW